MCEERERERVSQYFVHVYLFFINTMTPPINSTGWEWLSGHHDCWLFNTMEIVDFFHMMVVVGLLMLNIIYVVVDVWIVTLMGTSRASTKWLQFIALCDNGLLIFFLTLFDGFTQQFCTWYQDLQKIVNVCYWLFLVISIQWFLSQIPSIVFVPILHNGFEFFFQPLHNVFPQVCLVSCRLGSHFLFWAFTWCFLLTTLAFTWWFILTILSFARWFNTTRVKGDWISFSLNLKIFCTKIFKSTWSSSMYL